MAQQKWRGTLALAVAVAALSICSTASAAPQVFTPVDGAGLADAITQANGNANPSDTDIIRLCAGCLYQPTPAAIPQITQSVAIIGDPKADIFTTGPVEINGSQNPAPSSDQFVVNAPGATVYFRSFRASSLGGNGFGAFRVSAGTARFDNVEIDSSQGANLTVATNATAVVSGSSVHDGLGFAMSTLGSGSVLTLNNVTLARNASGIARGNGSTINLNNTIVSDNGGNQCVGNATTTADHSLVSDNTCTGTASSGINLGPSDWYGGPTYGVMPNAGSSAIDAGNDATCYGADQRFYIRPKTNANHCDIGAMEQNSPGPDTTGPTCVVTAVRNGPPKQQDVTVQDLASGIAGNDYYDGFTNPFITNGTIGAVIPPNDPSNAGLVVTATKTDQTQTTFWTFDYTDWAGNTTHCA
jgi:hypothetical protein